MNRKTENRILEDIPGIGPRLAKDLRDLGIRAVSDLNNKDPEKLYAKLERLRGRHEDRCVLYTFRCAVYFAKGGRNPEGLKWWNWKDAKRPHKK